MTAPQKPLVEKVARAISQWMNGDMLPSPPDWERMRESTRGAYRNQAQAALDACVAEELAAALRDARLPIASLVMLSPMPGVGYLPQHPELLTRIDTLLAKIDGGAS